MNKNLLTICEKLVEESKLYCVPGEEFNLEKDSHRFFAEFLCEYIVKECCSCSICDSFSEECSPENRFSVQ
jgi:hypothetical protein